MSAVFAALFFLLFSSSISYAESGRADYDLDGDGLIEINDLDDLDEIRNNRYGRSLYSVNTGCPVDGCTGFELTTDLDFDTNQDGVIDSQDDYWNANTEGEGWLPIGNTSDFFSATFQGNGHAIRNLYINRPNSNFIGLFGVVWSAKIDALSLTGSLMSVTGDSYVGSLAGDSRGFSKIKNSFNTGPVMGEAKVGGLLGEASYCDIINSFNTGSVQGSENTGGLLGDASSCDIIGSFNSGSVLGADDTGGLVGYSVRGKISASSNTGSVQGANYTGGLVGRFHVSDSQVIGSFNTGSVQGISSVGGLIGYDSSDSQIGSSFNTGSVMAESSSVGGLIGYSFWSSQISASFNSGTVHGTSMVGGLLGAAYLGPDINASFNVGAVSASSYVGGLVGLGIYSMPALDSYWASDSSGQASSYYRSSVRKYVGLTLAAMQCATQANTTFNNSNCVSSDGEGEGVEDPIILFEDWQLQTQGDQALWDFGSNSQLPGLVLNGVIYRDGDGDGLLDSGDQLPFDTDNDGINNVIDAYPFIALGDLLDSDSDGAPDECDLYCSDLGMSEDNDDDNDGVLDVNDTYPLISLGELTDTDNDGAPDTCDESCLALGMFDDGDDDNDGVLDEFDRDNNADNGLPELMAVPENISLSVNNEGGTHATLTWDSTFYNQFSAYDVFDGYDLNYVAKLKGDVLTINDNGEISLPSGPLEIEWMAVDAAGNQSNSLTQVINIYPQVRFLLADSITGDSSTADVEVELSGESPEYPVVVNIQINQALSSELINQGDFEADFDVNNIHQIIIEKGGDPEAANTKGKLPIPIAQNDTAEYNELIAIDIVAVVVEEGKENYFTIDEQRNQHELTIGYQNFAPQVELQIEQGGKVVTSINPESGEVTVTVLIRDVNDFDEHTIEWNVNSLAIEAPQGRVLTFTPSNIVEGNYVIEVTVTDSGENSLSGSSEVNIDVALPPSNDAGIGSLWWLTLSLAGLAVPRRRVLYQ